MTVPRGVSCPRKRKGGRVRHLAPAAITSCQCGRNATATHETIHMAAWAPSKLDCCMGSTMWQGWGAGPPGRLSEGFSLRRLQWIEACRLQDQRWTRRMSDLETLEADIMRDQS